MADLGTLDSSSSAPNADARYRFTVIAVAFAGGFMVMLDTTILGVALPTVGEELGALDNIEWAITAYLLAVAALQPATGWLADRFGRKRVFTWSMAVFTFGSLLVAMSPTFGWLVAFRVLQGLGGASVMPMGFAIVYDAYPPHRRGSALGLLGIAGMAAPAFGPLIGGWIASSVAWQWLFLVNVPVGVLAVIAASRLLRDTGFRERSQLDWQGWMLAGVGLTAILLGLDRVQGSGWGSSRALLSILLGLVFLAAFVWRQNTISYPLIRLEMFRVRIFQVTLVIMWFVTFAMFTRIIFLSLELQIVRGLSPLETGLLLSPAAVGSAAMMPIGGRLADRVSVRLPIVLGTVLIATATFLLGRLSSDTPLILIALFTLCQGAGTGLSIIPNNVAALNSLPNRLVSQASAMRSLNRSIAGAFGVALLVTVITSRLGGLSNVGNIGEAQSAYNTVFLYAAAGAVVAMLLATRLPGKQGTQALHEARRNEMPAAPTD